MGLRLPEPQTTVYEYVPVAIYNDVAYVAGQIPKTERGLLSQGTVAADLSTDDAKEAARVSVLQALAWIDAAAGGLDNVAQVLRMTCYVAATREVETMSDIADAASGLLVELYGGSWPASAICRGRSRVTCEVSGADRKFRVKSFTRLSMIPSLLCCSFAHTASDVHVYHQRIRGVLQISKPSEVTRPLSS